MVEMKWEKFLSLFTFIRKCFILFIHLPTFRNYGCNKKDSKTRRNLLVELANDCPCRVAEPQELPHVRSAIISVNKVSLFGLIPNNIILYWFSTLPLLEICVRQRQRCCDFHLNFFPSYRHGKLLVCYFCSFSFVYGKYFHLLLSCMQFMQTIHDSLWIAHDRLDEWRWDALLNL